DDCGPERGDYHRSAALPPDAVIVTYPGIAKGRTMITPGRFVWFSAPVAVALLCLGQLPSTHPAPAGPPPQVPIDFSRQVRPILWEFCFACHGPDDKHRKAKLRLDTKEGAFAALRSGGFAVVPGKAGQSELIVRITSADADAVMPPPKSNKKLKPEQIEIL